MAAYKQVIVLRIDLGMSKGKLITQGAHASLEAAVKTMSTDKIRKEGIFQSWIKEGAKKIVVKVESEQALLRLRDLCVKNGIRHALIRDAGLTEIQPGTITALGIGPDEEKKVDLITKNLNAL